MSQYSINIESITLRIVALVAGGVILALFFLFAGWFLGSAISEDADTLDLAEFATQLVPGDPRAHQTTALLLESSFNENDLKRALSEAEKAASLSPEDFVLWETVAKLRERKGDIGGAERALRRALSLAPNNAAVQWAFGNVLLRQDRTGEAFAFIRKAAEGHDIYVQPAASIAWDFFEGDRKKVKEAIGNSDEVKAAVAVYLARQKKFDESLEFWSAVSKPKKKKELLTQGQEMLSMFVSAKKFFGAASITSEILENVGWTPQTGKIYNGSFEEDIPREKSNVFDWSIAAGDNPSVGVSVEIKRNGRRSLALLFDGMPGAEFRKVSQTIPVTPGSSHEFTFWYQSKLDSNATLVWQVANANDGTILAESDPVVAGRNWVSFTSPFVVPEDSEGIVIQLARAQCKFTSCPIRGTVWFDDLEVK